MNNRITVRTDASKKSDWGVGIGFDATLYHERETERMKGSKYIKQSIKTSEAEFQAVAYAVEMIYNELDGNVSEYDIVVESDHSGTPKRIKEDMNEDHDRLFWSFIEEFASFDARWISREINEVADSLAKSALRNGYESRK